MKATAVKRGVGGTPTVTFQGVPVPAPTTMPSPLGEAPAGTRESKLMWGV
ncbi:hypothetical protein [Streptomyces sp. NPDC003719]